MLRNRLEAVLWPDVATWQRRLAQFTIGFLVLGVLLRATRYLLRYPLWGDECLLAVNFIDHGFWGLVGALDNHQVAPVGFLWLELAATKLLGFSEYSLRLVPVIAGCVALVLLYRFAREQFDVTAALFAVALFAVSHYAIRHATEVKPYAVDAMVTMALVYVAAGYWREPLRWVRLWWLTALSCATVLLSFPSIFVVGAISLATLPLIWKARRSGVWLAFAAYNMAAPAVFFWALTTSTGAQFEAERTVMQDYWADAFPPLNDPLRLPLWFVGTHTGEMFAYPVGGERGGSVLTFICFVVGTVALLRGAGRQLAITTLGMLGLALVAAALGRYPYGGHPRLMQYAAPLICLVAGVGIATLFDLARTRLAARRTQFALVSVFLLIGIGLFVRTCVRPYQTATDLRRREVLRDFVHAESQPPGKLVSLSSEFQVELFPRPSIPIGRTVFRCNEWIYGPRPEQHLGEVLEGVGRDRLLRCLTQHVAGDAPDDERFEAWLAELEANYNLELSSQRMVRLDSPNEPEVFRVYEFTPRDENAMTARRRGTESSHQ